MWVFPFVLTRPARTSCHQFEIGNEFQRIDDWGGNPVNQRYQDPKGRVLITSASAFKIKPLNFQHMAKSKKANPVSSINLELPTAIIDLNAICANIWYKFFNDKSLTKADKDLLRTTYNDAARAINKVRPGTIVIMSDNPKWKPSTPEEGKYIPPSHDHLSQHAAETTDAWLGRVVISGADLETPIDDEVDVPIPAKKSTARVTTAPVSAGAIPKKEGGTVAQIIALYESGVSKKDIIEVHGFNKNTVNRQVGEYIKRQK